MRFPEPLIFIVKELMIYHKLKVPEKNSKEFNSSAAYLERFKEVLNLPYSKQELMDIIEEKNNNYVITNDNFKKMVLLVYRIIANVPVIIMGDTGCGKTSLITKLNQILNGGNAKVSTYKNLKDNEGKTTLYIINIHPGYNDEKLCNEMDKANKEAKKVKEKLGKELWLFFDEINTCLSLSLITEIFINRTYNGKKLEDNIRLIGACNPYRKRKGGKEKCGLSRSDDTDNELVYLVQPLPQSLLYYVFSFGAIDEIDEKKYIRCIIEKLFTPEEENLHEMTTEAISKCHIYLRTVYDPSVVSLREISRFSKCIEFFQNYFTIKNKHLKRENNEKNNKLRSIICSIYLCYYIRLTNKNSRGNFDAELREILIKLVTGKTNIEEKVVTLMDQIKSNKLFYDEINKRPLEEINQFSDFLKIEQDFLIEQIELDKGIGKNALLKENVFLLFLSIITNIPLIIIGKPGTGKSLSAQLIYKSMKGNYSKNPFFRNFPKIIQIYFQGSKSTKPEDVESLFEKAKQKYDNFKAKRKEESAIIMVLFDELGLAERSESNPLKVLHEKLEYAGKDEGVSFVGISNYTLDAAKINRALVLSVPDLDQNVDDLIETSKNIVESIFDRLKDEKIFEIISNTYFSYKQELQIIKELVAYKTYKKYIGGHKEQPKGEIQETKTISGASSNQTPKNNDKVNGEEEKRSFEEIKKTKAFRDILKKENKIQKDFHGNRDFYNLIRGIATELRISGDSTDSEKSIIAAKYIERNVGGIDYEIDIELEKTLEDIKPQIELIKSILSAYVEPEEKKAKKGKSKKLSSVFLFKKLYNIECEKDDPNSNLKIDELKINDYNLNNCIIHNIEDTNSRYLLLEIEPSLTTLIYENIKNQNSKETILYDGSPFVDDNNNEYRFKIINLIQDDAKENKLILLENLNQIHPFLFDLYNMNYIINNGKKFVRIALENFNDQLTEVNEEFRIIVLTDRRSVRKYELAFLNRFEKMILSFGKLLNDDLKRISRNLIKDIKLEATINDYNNENDKINYSLKDLLINCGEEDIQSLIFYFSNEEKGKDDNDDEEEKKIQIDENAIREKVIAKIYKILPQDIICILSDTNIIKTKYRNENTFSNLKDYLNYIKSINEEENIIKYKISIIYTYTAITNMVDGLNKGMSFNVAQIRSEGGLKNTIEEIKKKNEYSKFEKEYNIFIDFDQLNAKKLKFISNFILNNFKKDKYNYIFIIHINRNFNIESKEKIKVYSLPDISPSINQLFIDNLNGNSRITLKDFLNESIRDVLQGKEEELNLIEEFNKTLVNVLTNELNSKGLDDNEIEEYIKDLKGFLNEEDEVKKAIIETAYALMENNEDEDTKCSVIIEKIIGEGYVNKFTVDISSCVIEYIKENIFNNYIKKVLLKLEDNNIITTLIELKRNDFKEIDKSIIRDITIKYLEEIAKEKNQIRPDPKFLYNYNVPGLYNFYKDISDYICKNITSNYFNNEKKLREALKIDDNGITKFHETQDSSVTTVEKYYNENNEIIREILNKISHNLIFKDYITYYLQKNRNNFDIYNKNDLYHKLIELLIKLRFKDDKISLFMKMIWIESNVNYILNIIKIFENTMQIFEDENKLFNKLEELVKENKIKYITNEKKKSRTY
jgi:MoxR-like ATPase